MWDKPDLLNAIATALFTCAFLLAAYASLRYVMRLPVFPLREVRVNSQLAHVTREQLETLVKREFKGNFFTLELEAARRALGSLPWVRRVDVRRQWPDRLDVAIEEHVALARWGNAALVNTHGEVFTAAIDRDLPLFAGPEASAKEIAIQYDYFKRRLAAIGQEPREVRLTARRAWQIRLANGLILKLGREGVEARLDRYIGYYSRTIHPLQRRLDYVDLRYPNGFAVRVPELATEPPRARAGQNTVRR